MKAFNIEKAKAALTKVEDLLKLATKNATEANAMNDWEMARFWDVEVKQLSADVKRIKSKIEEAGA